MRVSRIGIALSVFISLFSAVAGVIGFQLFDIVLFRNSSETNNSESRHVATELSALVSTLMVNDADGTVYEWDELVRRTPSIDWQSDQRNEFTGRNYRLRSSFFVYISDEMDINTLRSRPNEWIIRTAGTRTFPNYFWIAMNVFRDQWQVERLRSLIVSDLRRDNVNLTHIACGRNVGGAGIAYLMNAPGKQPALMNLQLTWGASTRSSLLFIETYIGHTDISNIPLLWTPDEQCDLSDI